MKYKTHITLSLLLSGWQNVVLADDSKTIKSYKGEVVLSEALTGGNAWGVATYKNKEISFEFPASDDSDYLFVAGENDLSKDKKILKLFGQPKHNRSFVCYLVEMDSGCIFHADYTGELCAMNWDDKKDATLISGTEAHDISEFEPRKSSTTTKADGVNVYKNLKALNGSRTEKLCGVSPDGSIAPNPIQHEPLPNNGTLSVSFQEILKTCKAECNKKDLAAIDVKSISTISKTQISTVNDLAFYMGKYGLYSNAVDLLGKVIIADPERTPAYLNLGDSLWDSNEKSEANKYYAIYVQKMTQAAKGNKVPERVGIRMASQIK